MKSKKILKIIIYFTLISFMFSYFIEKSGYYEYNLQEKKNLTEEGIEQFEKDVKEGKNIDINNYLKNSTPDYSNNLTRTTSNFSINLNKYLTKIISKTFKIFGILIK